MGDFFFSLYNRPAIRRDLVFKITFSGDMIIRFFGFNNGQFNIIEEWQYETHGEYMNELVHLKAQE